MKAIRNISLILLCGLLTVAVTSCKKEKKTDNIITKIKPQAAPSDKPQQLSDFEYKNKWNGWATSTLLPFNAMLTRGCL